MPACGLVRSSAEYESCPDACRPKGTDPNTTAAVRYLKNKLLQNEDLLLPNLQVVAGTNIRFTLLPDRCPLNASPSQITQAYMDCFSAVEELLRQYNNPIGVIDECQIAFVFFYAGCCVDALAHWRKILNLLSNSELAVERFTDVYLSYMSVIEHQLPMLPDEMLSPGAFNTIFKDVQKLLRNCSIHPATKNNANILTESLKHSISWIFDIEVVDPEDLPIVVET